MKEVAYVAFCDAKSLLLWAKKLLRDHRHELGGGMYAHAGRLEWVWPNDGQSMELTFAPVDGGCQMRVRFSEGLASRALLVDAWFLASGKVRSSTPPEEAAPSAQADANEESHEGIFPADLIQQRWKQYTLDERAYATCLFECVRYEHLVRKRLPAGALEAAEGRDLAQPEEREGEDAEVAAESFAAEPRRSLGFISSVFCNHPAIRPLLEACGTYHHFWLLNNFRNSLIHVRTSKQLSGNAIRKRYRRLQMAIFLLQRWPSLERLYRALELFDERRRPTLVGLGPPAHPCRLIKHLGAEGLPGYYGVTVPEAMRLMEAGALFVPKTSQRGEEDYQRAIADLEKLGPNTGSERTMDGV